MKNAQREGERAGQGKGFNMNQPNTLIEKLEAERQRIFARQKRRRAEAEKDSKRLDEIREAINRQRLIALVAMPNAVVVGCRKVAGDSLAYLNHARGTILAVHRTRASVRWDRPDPRDGYHGTYTWHLSNLLPAEKSECQGFEVAFRTQV